MRKHDNTILLFHTAPGVPPQQYNNVANFRVATGEVGKEYVWEYDMPTKFDDQRKPVPSSIVRAELRISVGKVVLISSWQTVPAPELRILPA